MNQIQVTCDKECIYRNDGFCECDQHLLDIAEEFLTFKGKRIYWCSKYGRLF